MTQQRLLLSLVLLLLAGIGVAFGTGLLSPDDAEVVAWTEEDEIAVEAAPVENAEAGLGEAGNGNGRQEVAGGPELPALDDGDAERPDIRLRGRVVDGFGQPVAAVQVVLELQRNRFGRGGGRPERQQVRKPVTTGSDGRFAFEGKGFRDMAVTLRMSHQRFAPTFSDHDFRDAKGDLDVGDVRIRLGGEIRGLVTNIDGTPVPLATVVPQPQGGNRLTWTEGRDELVPPVQTDGNGQFRLQHLPAGEYRVEASAPRMLRAWSDRIAVDDELVEEIEPLRLGPGHELRGIVFGPDSRPVQGARVQLSAQERGPGAPQQRTDKEGKFGFDHLPSAALTLRVQAEGFLTWSQSDILPAQSGVLTITLRDGLKLTGEVHDAVTNALLTSYGAQVRRIGGLPADQNVVAQVEASVEALRQKMQAMRDQMQRLPPDSPEAQQQSEAMRQQMRDLVGRMREMEGNVAELRNRRGDRGGSGERGGPGGGRGGRGGPTPLNIPGDTGKVLPRPEGRFSFGGLDEGIYVVDIGAPDHVKLRSQQVELRAGQSPPHLVLMAERGLIVQGSVVEASNGEPIPNSDVELMLVNDSGNANSDNPMAAMRRQFGPRGFTVQRVKTSQTGEFKIANVAPGRYALRAQARSHSNASSEPFDLTQDSAGTKLALGALSMLFGRVSGIPPHRLQEARVYAFGGPGNMKNVDVRPDGTYELADLQPGDLLVRAVVGDMRQALGSELLQLFGGMRMGPGGQGQPQQQPALPFDVKLGPGERKQLDLQARIEETGTVSGVVMKNGLPAKGLRVTLRPQESTDGQAGLPGGGRGGRRGGEPDVRFGERFGAGRIGGLLGRSQQATTDGKGAFRFEDVPVGAYDLVVSTGGRGGSELHKEPLQVRAEAESRTSVSILSGAVTGRVRAEAGVDAAALNGNVQLLRGTKERPADMQAWNRANQTISLPIRGGTFRSSDVPAGDYLLIATIRGREAVEQTIYVTAGGEASLELQAGKPRTGGQGGGQPQQPGNGGRQR